MARPGLRTVVACHFHVNAGTVLHLPVLKMIQLEFEKRKSLICPTSASPGPGHFAWTCASSTTLGAVCGIVGGAAAAYDLGSSLGRFDARTN